jgi:hypothetical protein
MGILRKPLAASFMLAMCLLMLEGFWTALPVCSPDANTGAAEARARRRSGGSTVHVRRGGATRRHARRGGGRHHVRHRAAPKTRYAYPLDFFMMKAPDFDRSPLPDNEALKIRTAFNNGAADVFPPNYLIRAGAVKWYPLRGGIFNRREKVKYVVVHSTETGVPQDSRHVIDAWSSGGRRHPGTQYIVDRDGTIWCAVDPAFGAVHVNIFKTLPGINNDNTIGIEMCHAGSQTYPPEQRQSVTRLVAYLQDRYHVLDENVITHRYAQQGDHTDPVNFDWEGFLANKSDFRRTAIAYKNELRDNEIVEPDLPVASVFLEIHQVLDEVEFLRRRLLTPAQVDQNKKEAQGLSGLSFDEIKNTATVFGVKLPVTTTAPTAIPTVPATVQTTAPSTAAVAVPSTPATPSTPTYQKKPSENPSALRTAAKTETTLRGEIEMPPNTVKYLQQNGTAEPQTTQPAKAPPPAQPAGSTAQPAAPAKLAPAQPATQQPAQQPPPPAAQPAPQQATRPAQPKPADKPAANVDTSGRVSDSLRNQFGEPLKPLK